MAVNFSKGHWVKACGNGADQRNEFGAKTVRK
jgi:hypothetical protein